MRTVAALLEKPHEPVEVVDLDIERPRAGEVMGGPGPLFRPGAIDVAALAAMTLALAVGWQALRRTTLQSGTLG